MQGNSPRSYYRRECRLGVIVRGFCPGDYCYRLNILVVDSDYSFSGFIFNIIARTGQLDRRRRRRRSLLANVEKKLQWQADRPTYSGIAITALLLRNMTVIIMHILILKVSMSSKTSELCTSNQITRSKTAVPIRIYANTTLADSIDSCISVHAGTAFASSVCIESIMCH